MTENNDLSENLEEKAFYYLSMGQLMEKQENFDGAVQFYIKAFGLEPSHTTTWYLINNNLGFSLNKLGRCEEAEKYCRAAIAINPERHNAFKNLAISLQNQGQLLEAAWNYAVAVKKGVTDLRAINLLETLVKEHPSLLKDNPDLKQVLEDCCLASAFALGKNLSMKSKLQSGEISIDNARQMIATSLLVYAKRVDPRDLFPSLENGATDFVLNNPYAFSLATCLNRGARADIIWTIPYWIYQDLGHIDPEKIYKMSLHDLTEIIDRLPKKPRFVDVAPQTIHEITKIIVEEFNGNASLIWAGKGANDVRKTFLRVFGVGSGIANMAVILIEKAINVRFSDLDRRHMDIKPDVNTMRVLFRLGIASTIDPTEAILAARKLNPDYPGEIDGALWMIGKHFCKARNPNCPQCPVTTVCTMQID